MALIIHYPFTDGLKDISGNNNNLTYVNNAGHLAENTSGKIGKCQERKTYNTTDLYRSTNKITLSNDFTMCCWAYVTQCHTNTANGLVTNHSHSGNSGSGITVKDVSSTDFRISCNTGTGTSRTYHSYYGTSNIKDKWSHLTVRYNKSLKELTLWVNGTVEKTVTYSMYSPENYVEIFNWSTSNTSSTNYRPVCKLNDVRVYDHALSDKEIYDISKAKILHYKFNNQKRGNVISDDLTYISHTPYHNLTQSERYVKCVRQTGSTSSHLTIRSSSLSTTGKTFRVSGKMFINGKPVTVDGLSTYQGTPDKVINNPKTGFFSIIQKYDHATSSWIFHKSYVAPAESTTEIFDLTIEELSSSETGVSETIDDSSDFNNSVQLSNLAPSWTHLSKIGEGASDFGGQSASIRLPSLYMTDGTKEFSVGFWIKMYAHGGNQIPLGFSGEHNMMYTFGDGLPSDTLGFRSLINGVWHTPVNTGALNLNTFYHVFTTYSPTTGYKLYLNGELKNSSALTGITTVRVGSNNIGCWATGTTLSRHLNGVIDDFRFYGSTISDKDVSDIYNTRFNIDNKGNFSLNELNIIEDAYYNRGEYNLIRNGNMQLKNNENFPGLTYSSSANGVEDTALSSTRQSNDFVEFDFRDSKKQVDLSFTLKNTSGNGTITKNYLGIACYDKNKQFIQHNMVSFYSNTRTTLSQDLNNGDTIIHLTSAANWTNLSHTRRIAIFDAHEYPDFTYTRTIKVYADGGLDIPNNRITMTSAWSGATIPAGTSVCNAYDGGSYNYIVSSNSTLTDGQEKKYSTTFSKTSLRYGTKYFKTLMLLNRNSTSAPKTLIKDITAIGKYGSFEKDQKVSFKENGVCASNIDEIGTTEGLVGYYKFDDFSDSSNEQNDLTNFGVTINNGIATFDGSSGAVSATKTSLDVDYITTVSVIKPDLLKTGENILINKENSYETRIVIGTDYIKYSSAIKVGTAWAWLGETTVPYKSEYVFLATTWNGNKITNYVNEGKNSVSNQNNQVGAMTHSSYGLGIGSRGVPSDGSTKGGGAMFKGDMKETRIYNRALTEDEVLTLYKVMMKQTANIKDKVFYVNEIKEV